MRDFTLTAEDASLMGMICGGRVRIMIHHLEASDSSRSDLYRNLAAGTSSRMERFKPLAPLGSSTLIGEAVSGFRAAGISEVRVVVGHRADELTPVLERLNVRWVFNAEHQRGMFSSVMAGVASFEPGVGAYDPMNPKVVYPQFDGKRGHPPLVPAVWLAGELSPENPGGLQTVPERHESRHSLPGHGGVDGGPVRNQARLWLPEHHSG